MRRRGPVLGRDADRGAGEHQVRDHGPAYAARYLGGKVGRRLAPPQPAERGVREGHHRVKVTARDRPEHQDDREQADRGRRRVLQQLQPHCARRQALRGDTRADHHRGQERAAQQLSQQPPPQCHVAHRRNPSALLLIAVSPRAAQLCHGAEAATRVASLIDVYSGRASLPGWIDSRQDRGMSMQAGRLCRSSFRRRVAGRRRGLLHAAGRGAD